MSRSAWAAAADAVLATLFVPGAPPPGRAALVHAYPFGERKHWPYAVWLRQVKAWRAAHALGLRRPMRVPPARRAHRSRAEDRQTLDLFSGART